MFNFGFINFDMDKWSNFYSVLRMMIKVLFYFFYRKVTVTGKKNIPQNASLIFAPNHQNAMMDPLAVVFTQEYQTIFLTRADIFDNPILLKIFTSFKMLPVYRIRDGAESLKNNELIFSKSVQILESKDKVALSLFPEATHNDKNFLRPLKKAIPRISFQALEESDFKLDVKIVPVGIYYSNYENSYAHIHINYGKAFSVNEYEEEYKENPQKAMNSLKNRISDELKKYMLNIEDKENYDFHNNLRLFLQKKVKKKYDWDSKVYDFFAFKKIIETIERISQNQKDIYKEISKKFIDYKSVCDEIGIDFNIDRYDKIIFKILFNIIVLTLGFPVFIYALINHFYIYFPLQSFLKKKVKDRQFHSSIKFGVGIITPFLQIIQSLIFAIFLPDYFWYYLASLPISAYIALVYKYYYRRLLKQIRYYIFKVFNRKKYLKLRKEATALQDQILDYL